MHYTNQSITVRAYWGADRRQCNSYKQMLFAIIYGKIISMTFPGHKTYFFLVTSFPLMITHSLHEQCWLRILSDHDSFYARHVCAWHFLPTHFPSRSRYESVPHYQPLLLAVTAANLLPHYKPLLLVVTATNLLAHYQPLLLVATAHNLLLLLVVAAHNLLAHYQLLLLVVTAHNCATSPYCW